MTRKAIGNATSSANPATALGILRVTSVQPTWMNINRSNRFIGGEVAPMENSWLKSQYEWLAAA